MLNGNVFLSLTYSPYPSFSWPSCGENEAVLLASLGYQPITIVSILLACSGSSVRWTWLGTQDLPLHQAGVSLTNSIEWGGLLPSISMAAPKLLSNLGNKLYVWPAPKHLCVITLSLIFCHIYLTFNVIWGKGRVMDITSYWLSMHITHQFVISFIYLEFVEGFMQKDHRWP